MATNKNDKHEDKEPSLVDGGIISELAGADQNAETQVGDAEQNSELANQSSIAETPKSDSGTSRKADENEIPSAPNTSQTPPTGNASKGKDSIGKTFGVVAILTILSKVIGLVRDIVVAHAFGTGIVADAYNYAYQFTGNVLILFGGLGGPFHSSTVAVLGGKKDDENAGRLVTQVFAVTFVALTIISVVAYLVAPYVADFMASNYKIATADLPSALRSLSEGELHKIYRDQLLTQFNIMLPLIVISGLVGISYGVLNVYNKIFWPSLSPAIASIAIIVAILGFSNPETAPYTGVPLAVGTLIGAIGQLVAQIPDTLKTKLKWSLSFKPEQGCNEYAGMLWPAIFSTSVGQLTVYVDCLFTNTIGQGAWTAVLMSNRLVQLPLGVLLTAMLVPILPRFTEQASADRIDDLKAELRRSLRFLWFLSLPLATLFLVIPDPIIKLLFQHGEFNQESTRLVTLALVYLAPSIFFYVARDLMTRVFYAFKDSNTPFRVALVAIAVKGLLDYVLVFHTNLGVAAISLASTLITLMNLSLLTWFLKRKIGGLGFTKLVKPVGIMLFASALCGAAAYVISNAVETQSVEQLLTQTLHLSRELTFIMQHLISVGLSTAAAGIVYLVVCVSFKLEEPVMLVQRVPALKRIGPIRKIIESQKN